MQNSKEDVRQETNAAMFRCEFTNLISDGLQTPFLHGIQVNLKALQERPCTLHVRMCLSEEDKGVNPIWR